MERPKPDTYAYEAGNNITYVIKEQTHGKGLLRAADARRHAAFMKDTQLPPCGYVVADGMMFSRKKESR